jgi:serine/threonine protein kinase
LGAILCANSFHSLTRLTGLGDVFLGVVSNGATDSKGSPLNVALKQLRSRKVTKRWRAEAETLKAMKHKNIVGFWGIHTSADGGTYLVTSFCNCGSLLQFLRRKGSQNELPKVVLCDILRQSADGLAYLGRKQMVHGGSLFCSTYL